MLAGLSAVQGDCQREVSSRASLVLHVCHIGCLSSEPEMTVPLIGDTTDCVGARFVIAGAELDVAGVSNDPPLRDRLTGSPFPSNVMGESVAPIVLQVSVAARLLCTGPEATFATDDERRPRGVSVRRLGTVETSARTELRLRTVGTHAGDEHRSTRRACTLNLHRVNSGASPRVLAHRWGTLRCINYTRSLRVRRASR